MKMELDWLDNLQKEVEAGNIRVGKDTNRPLRIYNYTQKAQFSQHWNDITLTCRGLILDNDGKVVVLPPKKFFNQNEPLAAKVNLKTARISEKLDGMMIILKVDSDWGLIITSRGSFDNKYTEAVKSFITDDIVLKMAPNYTYFCELLQNFPGDEAIILTKHPIPKLVCWAIKDENFNEVSLDDECPFPTVEQLSLAEAKQYLEQKVEGVVAQDPKTFERVKIKTDYYLKNHRLISDCTKKRIWEVLSSGNTVENLDIPDEFMPQMQAWQTELQNEHLKILNKIKSYQVARSSWSDKMVATDGMLLPEEKALLFTLRKHGEDSLKKQIWGRIKPRNVL